MFAPVLLVDEGSASLSADDPSGVVCEPRAGEWVWQFDPLGDAWWDPADEGAEPDIEVDPHVEALLGYAPGSEADPQVSVLLGAGAGAGVVVDGPVDGLLGLAPGVVVAPPVVGQPVPASAAWRSAACLAAVAPGAGLAGVLERVDLASADDELLVEVVAAGERQAALGHLQAAEAAAVLSRRASMRPHWHVPVPANACVAGDELAMRLGWSKPAARRLVRDGRALDNELLLVAEAVREGVIDTSKVRVLTDRLHERAYQLAWPVLDEVLPQAATRTPSQLASDIDRALLTVAPQDAAIRLPRAIASRHVCHPRRLPDGMAGLWAVLPAVDAARIDATLEATARTARAAGDPRTLDQLRADTLTDLATGHALLAGATLLANTSLSPMTGAVTAQGATASMTTRDPDRAGTPAAPADDTEPEPDDAGSQPDDADQEFDAPPGVVERPPGRAAPGIRIPKIRIDVTVALSTLMGLDELPAELAGLGPIPADQARALALGGTWRRIVTDPLTGTVLDVGRTRYRPPAALAEHVIARDGVCAAPGCGVPGHRCDLDHTTEYHGTPANGAPQRGSTAADNLGPLSTRCHRLKTDGGFTLTQIEPGVFEWHTPAGLAYRVTPGNHGRTQKLDTHTRSSYPDNPPF